MGPHTTFLKFKFWITSSVYDLKTVSSIKIFEVQQQLFNVLKDLKNRRHVIF